MKEGPTQYSTDSYQILIQKDEDGKPFYAVLNTATGVVEYEDNILPRTLDATKNLQQLHDEAISNFNSDAPALTLVGEGNDGGPRAH